MKKFILSISFILLCNCASANQINNNEDYQHNILNGINVYRTSHGMPPLKLNQTISKIAAEHSREMANNSVAFGHAGFKDRMYRIYEQFRQPRGIAENVAFAGGNANTLINLWLNSKGHRKNIEGNYNLTGIGIAQDNYGRTYATQIFLNSQEQ